MKADKDIIAKIAKLLELAKSSNPHEASLAASRAKEMMEARGLTMTEVEVQKEGIEEYTFEPTTTASKGKPIRFLPQWMKGLTIVMNKHFDVMCFLRQASRKGKNTATVIGFIGTPTDIQVAEYIFNYLVREIGRMADEHKKTLDDYEGNKWSYLNTYRLGLVKGLREELQRKEKESFKAHTSDGHALVEVKKAMIKRHMKESGNFKEQRSAFKPNQDSYGQGVKDGANISVNKGVSSGGSNGPLAIGE